MAYVYIYYDPRKNPIEPIYVGKGNNERFKDHLFLKTNNILNKKISKILKCGLSPIIEKYVDNISDYEAYEIEKELILKFGKLINNSGTLCNYCDGGKGGRIGFKHSEDTKKLMSDQRKGKKQTKKQYEANCNRVLTDDHKNSISKSLKGKKRSNESIEKTKKWHLGSKRSEDTKKLMSDQRKGKKQTEQHIKNAKLARKKSYIRKKVKCINNNKIYDSLTDASTDLNLKENAIASVARGDRKSHKGYIFLYI